MQHVVAEIAEQHRVLAIHAEHVAQWMADSLDPMHLFSVSDDLLRCHRGDRHPIGIGQLGQQRLGQRDLSDQVGFRQRAGSCRQQGQSQQVDRVHVGGAVDVHLDTFRQRIHGGAHPFRLFFVANVLCPVRRDFVEQGFEIDRLAKRQSDAAITIAQYPQGAEQREQGFFLFGTARQFADVGLSFHQLFVTDIHRLEHHRTARFAQETAQGYRQHATARREQPTGARTAALDEVFQRHAARKQLRHVFAEHGGVERITLEAPAQEKRTAATQDRTQHRQVQVDACSDVRRHDAVLVELVGQQDVVNVAAMAGHVDHFVAGNRIL